MENMQANKKGRAGLTVFFIIALAMVIFSSFISYNGFSAVPLGVVSGMPLFFSPYKVLLGAAFALGVFLTGMLNRKKGVAIAFSIVNMLIALMAFMPVRGYYYPLRLLVPVLSHNPACGFFYLLHFLFTALMMLFSLLTMLAAVRKNRRRPKGLLVLMLIVTCVYAAISLVSILFLDPMTYNRMRFIGLRTVARNFAALASGFPASILFMWRGTMHTLFPFTTLIFFLAMFCAARSIGPAAKAAPAFPLQNPAPLPVYVPQQSFVPEYQTQAAVFQEPVYDARSQELPVEPLNETEAAKERELRELASRLRSGAITEADYQALRQRILSR